MPTEAQLEETIARIIEDKFGHMLEDLSFRIGQAYDVEGRAAGRHSMVYAEDLNLPGRHFLTGYTLSNNSPIAGSVAWLDLHMVYSGVDYLLTNGNTALKYMWWSPTTTNTVLQSSNTKPVLGTGEVLLFVNTAGVAKVMLSDTNASLPTVLADGTVDSGSIIGGAVIAAALGTGAVTNTKLGALAVDNTKIASNTVSTLNLAPLAVTSAELGAGAVVAGKIGVGGISASNQIAGGMVDAAAIGTGAVTNTKLGALAVDGTKIAALAIDNTKIANNTITTLNLGLQAVDNTIIKDGAVGAVEIATGAVLATKLNILRHVMY